MLQAPLAPLECPLAFLELQPQAPLECPLASLELQPPASLVHPLDPLATSGLARCPLACLAPQSRATLDLDPLVLLASLGLAYCSCQGHLACLVPQPRATLDLDPLVLLASL